MNQNTFDFAKPPDPTKPPALPSRASDPETSKAAAVAHAPIGQSHEDMVVAAVYAKPGGSHHCYAKALNMDPHEVMKRLGDARNHRRIRSNPKMTIVPYGRTKACQTWWPIEEVLRKESGSGTHEAVS